MICIRHISRYTPPSPSRRYPLVSNRAFNSGRHARTSQSTSILPLLENVRENPLSQKLFELNNYGKRGKKKISGDRTRLNVVSESLCDDVLDRLAPSLKKHKNCDIIDLNPGVGLWSSKLHKAVKPRTHILMEPDLELYSPFLKSLIEQKSSKYKLVPKSGLIWENLEDLMTGGDLLKHQKQLQPDDPRLEQPNDTLLFVANMGYYPKKAFQGFKSITMLTIHQLLAAVRTHALFQRYGQVRMLIWLQDKEKSPVLPRMLSLRRQFSIDAEVSCEMIHEVAGSDVPTNYFRREVALDIESALAVKARMAATGINTPPARIGSLQERAAQVTSVAEAEKGLVTEKVWFAELADLERRYAAKKFPACYDDNGKPLFILEDENGTPNKISSRLGRTPEYKRMKRLQWNLAQTERKANIFEPYIVEYQGIMDELTNLQNSDSSEALEKRENATERLQRWRETVEHGLPDTHGERILHFIEERRCLHQDPPLLLWDRREAEPLMTFGSDFFPEHEMCLLDFHPKSAWPIISGKNIKNYDFFDFLISSLFPTPSQSLVNGLKAVAPGAAEWILPKCPSITNPVKGGVADVNQLTVRSLTQEMMKEIMEAWMEWPFRPTKAEMVARMMGMEVDDLDEEAKDP